MTRDELLNKAKEKFEYATQLYSEKRIDPSNLYHAMKTYQNVFELLKNLDNRPEIYDEAHEKKEAISRELQLRLKKLEHNALLQYRSKEYDAALSEYRKIIQIMPDSSDLFNQRARDQSQSIEERKKKNKK